MPGIVYDFRLTGVDLWRSPCFDEFGRSGAGRVSSVLRNQKIIAVSEITDRSSPLFALSPRCCEAVVDIRDLKITVQINSPSGGVT